MMKSLHDEDVKKIQAQLKAQEGYPLSLKPSHHHTSNMIFEKKYKEKTSSLDISRLNRILSIHETYVHVEPKVTMEYLAKKTLEKGLIPYVLPEFKGITVGGAIMGAALESSSHQFGQFNDNCLEYEILLGNGSIVTATTEKNSDLFYGISSSYGTLGIILSAKIKLKKALNWVHLHYHRFTDINMMLDSLHQLCLQICPQNEPYEYIDALIFSENEGVIMTGQRVDEPPKKIKKNYLRSWKPWFYSHARNAPIEEVIPLYDYLFRYDKGAFWMGKYLAHTKSLWQYLNKVKDMRAFTRAQKETSPFLNRLIPLFCGKYLGSTHLYKALHSIPQEWFQNTFVIQDFYIPIENALIFIEEAIKKTKIFPLWLCPIRQTDKAQILAPHYQNSTLLVDVGIYGAPLGDKSAIQHTMDLELLAVKLMGRKMLYANSYYSPAEFWKIYDKNAYDTLREEYHAKNHFLDITEKILKMLVNLKN